MLGRYTTLLRPLYCLTLIRCASFVTDLIASKNSHVSGKISIKADFHSVEFSDWTRNLLLTRENVALNLKRMLRMNNTLSCKFSPPG